MQFFDFLFGFGALVTPIVIGLLLPRLGYGGTVRILAIVSLAPLIMAFFAPMATSGGSAGSGTLKELFAGSVFWLTSLAFLFYVPLESSVAGWATTIVSRQSPSEGASSRLAGFSLMAFWLCFTGSRLLVALSGIKEGREMLLVALSMASVALMLGIAFLPGRWTAVTLIIAAGLVFGPIFPILISKMLGAAPSGVEGRAVGFFFAFGSVGWTLIPRLIGNVANRTNIQRGFLVAAASGVVFVAFVLIQHFRVSGS
jgi:fucose permease